MDIQWTILYIVMVCTLQPRTNINYITFLFTTVVQNNFLTAVLLLQIPVLSPTVCFVIFIREDNLIN